MQNILGVIDSSGNLVVKYKCDAWGNHSACNPDGRVNNSETFIGNINPFRYKGYYYDTDTEMYYCKSRYYNPVLGRFISPDSIEYLDSNNINGMNLYTYCYNDPVNYSDGSGHMPEWAQWLIGGALVVGAIALTICTVGASGALMSAGTQIIANGFENFSWSEVGKGAITGCIAGGIAGGFFAGIQYGLSAGKIANSVSGLSKAQTRLDNVFKPLNNIKNLSNMPFSGANIARNIGQVAGNYNSAYSAYILAKGAYAIVNTTAKVLYFVLENLTSNLIESMF